MASHHCHTHGDHDSSCKHGEHDHCCCCHGTCHHHDHEQHQDFAHQLLEMADEAWMEVLKDKIKQQIIASNGKQLDKLAKLVAESNKTRWKKKIGINKTINDFKGKLAEHLGQEE